MALMAALVGCQAPAGTAPQSQMIMRQLPKASKVVTGEKALTGTLKTVIKGNFDKAARSLLYIASDVDRLDIQIRLTTDPGNDQYDVELTRANNQIGGSSAVASRGGLPPGDYDIFVFPYTDGRVDPIGFNEGDTPKRITIAAGATETTEVRVQLSNTTVQGASLETTVTLLDGEDVVATPPANP